VRELRRLNRGKLNVQERYLCSQIVKIFRRKQRGTLLDVLAD
jgi:hypothetical protein